MASQRQCYSSIIVSPPLGNLPNGFYCRSPIHGRIARACFSSTDIRTLLVSAPRVSKLWHAIVTNSLPLQRRLFFQPDWDTVADGRDAPSKVQNPLLKAAFPAWFENTAAFYPPSAAANGDTSLYQFPVTATGGYKRFKELQLYKDSLTLEDNPFLRPSASWRRMFISQPPCSKMAVCSAQGPGPSASSTLGRPHVSQHDCGLRMGELYDLVLQHSVQHPISGFMVVWPLIGSTKPGGGREGDSDGDGYPHLVRHIARMMPFMFAPIEQSLQRVWVEQPDIVVQLFWTSRISSMHELNGSVLQKFWALCGSEAPSIPESCKKCGIDNELGFLLNF